MDVCELFFDLAYFSSEENICVAWQNSSDTSSSHGSTCMYEEKDILTLVLMFSYS